MTGSANSLVGLCALLIIVSAELNRAASDAAEVRVESAMDRDPPREFPPTERLFSAKLKALWIAALRQPDTDLQLQAAMAITRAHQLGMSGLQEAAGPLMETIDQAQQHPLVRLACAGALVELDARQSAPLLFNHWQRAEIDLASVVEPALASWKYEPIRQIWRDRLRVSQTRGRSLQLAMEGLAEMSDRASVTQLTELLYTTSTPPVRLRAAQALADLQRTGLEATAGHLMAQSTAPARLGRLLAVTLLKHHRGAATRSLLIDLAAEGGDPGVVLLALERLFELDSATAVEIAQRTIGARDARLRMLSVRILAARVDPVTVRLLAPVLSDRHPRVRNEVRRTLIRLARDNKTVDAVVRERALDVLTIDRWRGQEQAIVLLVALDHRRAAGRLVQLLDAQRPEVFRAAAWGLRELKATGALPAMLGKADRAVTAGLVSDMGRDVDIQVSYLMEAFGLLGYRAAEPLLRKCLPKKFSMGSETRAAAIWSLGHLYAGQAPSELSAMLVDRLNDAGSNATQGLSSEETAASRPPIADLSGPGMESNYAEVERVRCMCAISLARMQATEMIPDIRKHYPGTTGSALGHACGWALHQLTGEPLTRPATVPQAIANWFLEPLDP